MESETGVKERSSSSRRGKADVMRIKKEMEKQERRGEIEKAMISSLDERRADKRKRTKRGQNSERLDKSEASQSPQFFDLRANLLGVNVGKRKNFQRRRFG